MDCAPGFKSQAAGADVAIIYYAVQLLCGVGPKLLQIKDVAKEAHTGSVLFRSVLEFSDRTPPDSPIILTLK